LGATTTSSAVAVTVVANTPPTVSLTSPANGAVFAAPATINITATAADSDGTVAKVEIFSGAALLATLTGAPYTFSWTNVAAGSYVLTAVATDDRGAATTSSAVTVTVDTPPTVTLTATPTNAIAPATVT
jgi:hypothetical protein